jgi:hypothetical protein
MLGKQTWRIISSKTASLKEVNKGRDTKDSVSQESKTQKTYTRPTVVKREALTNIRF